MTILRHYTMKARRGHGAELGAALAHLAGNVTACPGSQGVETLADDGDSDRFVFIERWSSKDSHKAAGAMLGKEAFAPIMALLDEPPSAAYLYPWQPPE